MTAVFSVSTQVMAAALENVSATTLKVQPVKKLDVSKGLNDEKASLALSEKLQSLKSLTAHFQQQAVSSDGRTKTESGEMQMKRPDLFRWLTREPFEQEIVAHGNKVWMVDRELQQVIIQKQDARTANTPAKLLTGNAREMLKQYNVSVYSKDRNERYTLTPKEDSDLFEKLDIDFRHGMLTAIELSDSLGGKRRILFSGVKENTQLNDSLFEVKPPKGFDVIDETRG
ncbi:outer membrane lipoprotein chaperone LolA [Endozoicomonas sp. 8E]|uniref:outer membrane lipoprotein chaperone LolA n=1 Tax=Endozoicomonas sp. 8E TaxID=3035692 RepID=UPI002938EA3E|nr:outer membrane lipoprotein chaperone LolA [Endozoicomonas sp. 8E]WOG30049.1 outer membrane lipoprotein chaperone LolA [Endozoicomonas sp. 8E]